MGWVCCWVLWSVHIKSSPMYVTSQFWKSEQVCSGGGPKEPAQLHSLLNVGIQNGLSLLREDIKLQRCWSVLPLPLCHLSETSKLSSPGWHPGWWYPALLRLSPGKRGQRAVAPCDLLLLPSAGFEEASFFAGWGLGERTNVWELWQPAELAPSWCGLGGDVQLSSRCQCPVRLERSQHFLAKGLWTDCAVGGVSSSVCVALFSCTDAGVPYFASTALQLWSCTFSWLNHPLSTLFFRLLPILFPPLRSLSVYSLHYEDGSSECIRPRVLAPFLLLSCIL